MWWYHGGNGSSYQIIDQWHATHQVRGVIATPVHVEQQWNVRALQRLGLVVASGTLDAPLLLRPAVQRLVDALPVARPTAAQTAEYHTYRDPVARAMAAVAGMAGLPCA